MTPAFGATVEDHGIRFAAWSTVAERIEVCLFDEHGTEVDRIPLRDRADDGATHHSLVPGVGPGTAYGLRAHGPGLDPAKLLVDPAARRIAGDVRWTDALLAPGVDSAPDVPRCIVVAPPPPPPRRGEEGRPATAHAERVVYEAHVEALTARHPDVPIGERGRFPGLHHPAVVDHLQHLGVTTVELLPVQHFTSEQRVVALGRRNVWGYNPLGWGAPHAGYATAGGDPVAELRAAIDGLHDAGIEVFLDVVFNHTAEWKPGEGPTLSLGGLDPTCWYRSEDVTGCGNTVALHHPLARRLVREQLVRWAAELGVDGFRFDLATALFRGEHGPDPQHPFFAELDADPALAGVALIAEPWDLGPGGYWVGSYPARWSEWNDRFRNDVRDLWAGRPGALAAWATRLTGSRDVFGPNGRDATASVNYVAAHDGFTVADLVAYDHKHNEGNGEGGADGTSHNHSWNGGVEGPTDDPDVLEARRCRVRGLLGSALLAQGVPMLLAGDELGRTQAGNNNGYLLDDGSAWLDWSPEGRGGDPELAAWVAAAIRLRRQHPVLRRTDWHDGEPDHQGALPDCAWHHPDGRPMAPDDWHDPALAAVLVVLDGTAVGDGVLAVAVNAAPRGRTVALPDGSWQVVLDRWWSPDDGRRVGSVEVGPWGLVVLERA